MRFLILVSACLFAAGCGGANGNGFISGTPTLANVTPNPVSRGQNITLDGSNLNGILTIATFSATGVSIEETATSGGTSSVVVPTPTSGQIAAGTYNVSVVTTDGFGDFSSASNSLPITLN
jgi:hypothetical protein